MVVKRIIPILFCFLFVNFLYSSNTNTGKVFYKESIVAGSQKDFMMVSHIVLKGSNYEIGKKIAEIAKRYQANIAPSGNSLRNRVKRNYYKKNYPVFYERMKGVTDGYGLNVEDDKYDFTIIFQGFAKPGCSVVYYPPQFTSNKHGILSRNYDFTTGNFQGKRVEKGELSCTSRPVLFEIYPDQGYPSLFICAYDLLGGVIDGINSEGLTVAILAEEESIRKGNLEQGAQEVGLYELASMRYLLDYCKDVKQAKEALLNLKHFYSFIPCHYIIADKNGDSFIFEFSSARNKTYIIDGKGPQCITNHLVALHQDVNQLPKGNSFDRYTTLFKATADKKKYTLSEIKSINRLVEVPPYIPGDPNRAPGRTLWHALYDTHDQSLLVKFYLGESSDQEDKSKVTIKYSDYLHFKLKVNVQQ